MWLGAWSSAAPGQPGPAMVELRWDSLVVCLYSVTIHKNYAADTRVTRSIHTRTPHNGCVHTKSVYNTFCKMDLTCIEKAGAAVSFCGGQDFADKSPQSTHREKSIYILLYPYPELQYYEIVDYSTNVCEARDSHRSGTCSFRGAANRGRFRFAHEKTTGVSTSRRNK